jgi:hypothetical protein
VHQIREQQRQWIRAHRKYPDFIEIGLDVWDDLYDWHVRYQQPLNIARLTDGQYAMSFHFTTLILRPDFELNYISPPYDRDPTRRP